jgi:hypothetical protein
VATNLLRNSRPKLIENDGKGAILVLQLGPGPTNGRRYPGPSLPDAMTTSDR